jgi:hypothetical protein
MGLVAGTSPELAEAGGTRLVHCAGVVGRGGERNEGPRTHGPLWARWRGPARMNSENFHFIQIFKQIRICNGSKHIFPCSKNLK